MELASSRHGMSCRKATLLRWDRLVWLSVVALVCAACGLNPQPEPPAEASSSGGRGGTVNDSADASGGGAPPGSGGAAGSGATGNGGTGFDLDAGEVTPDAGDADPSAFMDGGEDSDASDGGDAGDASDAPVPDADAATDGELGL